MSNLFFRNPRLTILTISLILVSGLSSWFILPRLEDPVLMPRFATITTRFPGAGPERVESQLTEKIEEELEEIEEIKVVSSTSASEVSIIQIELGDEVTNIEEAWTDVRDKLDDVRPDLSAGIGDPFFEELDTRAFAMIIGLSWTGHEQPNYSILRRRAEDLQEQLLALPGTEEVELHGDPIEEIVVEIDPSQLVSLGLTARDLASQLAESDAKISAGQLRSSQNNLLIEVSNDLDTLERIRKTPVRYGSGSEFVTLSDIAQVRKGIRSPMVEQAIIDGAPGIALSTYVLPSQRIDLWANTARGKIADYAASLPAGLSLDVLFDQSTYTDERLSSLMSNLVTGGAIVIVVVLLLMGWRSALLVGLALPLSALMVFTGMRFLGIPIHQMSVTGLIIALGLLIDNAIVMVDEVGRELRKGHSPSEAISISVRKLAIPLFGSTLTTVFAFMPIALMPGPAGEFVGSIALSVILALISSLFLALTVVPALSGFLRRVPEKNGRFNTIRHGFSNERLARRYQTVLSGLFARPWWGALLGVILPVVGFIAGSTLKEQFFPPADRDQFHIQLELPAQTPIARTELITQQVRDQLDQYELVEEVHWFLGKSAPAFYYNLVNDREYASEYAQALVQLKSKRGALQLIRELQNTLDGQFPEARVLVRQLEQGPPFPAPVELRLYGPDIDRLRQLGQVARLELIQVPEVTHTRASLSEARPKLGLDIKEEELRLSGLTNTQLAHQVDATLEGAVGGSILEETEELPVRVRIPDKQRGDLDRIRSLELLASSSMDGSTHWVPLSAVSEISLTSEVAAITRRNGRRVNSIQSFVTAGVLPAAVLEPYQERMSGFLDELPPGYSYDWGGEASKRNDAVGNLMSSVSILMVLMVATLVLSFSSFRMAGIIGLVGVFSVGLGLLSLKLFGFPFGFMAIVGTMGLVGIAINDSIVVLTAIRTQEKSRDGDPLGVTEVVVEETRHVLATTFTTMAGFIPLLLSGGGFWPPLAITIAGGVLGATILALGFVPSAYILSMCPCRKKREVTEESLASVEFPHAYSDMQPVGF